MLDFLFDRFSGNKSDEAFVFRNRSYDYAWLLSRVRFFEKTLEEIGVSTGETVALVGDFSPDAVGLFLALAQKKAIVVPLTPSVYAKNPEFLSTAEVQRLIRLDANEDLEHSTFSRSQEHALFKRLRQEGHPGLVLFSSGSSGFPKAIVHDLSPLLEKYKVQRHRRRTMIFLLFDHIGGINTMLYTLSNTGCLVFLEDRSPEAVLGAIEKHRVEVLPATPTFLNLLLLSGAHEKFNLSPLKLITYGTEPMPERTLKRLHKTFPQVELLQTYGLSELGILRSKSKSPDSLWVKVGGEGFQTRVVDGILQIKAESAMLGYLNAPSPFTDDGWFVTGDRVEVDGEYLKILGRASEMINVGGQNVDPLEVESVIRQMDGVLDVTVYGQPHYVFGHYVCARVSIKGQEDPRAFARQVKKHCEARLERHKVPVKVEITRQALHSDRFKKIRSTFHAQ